MFCGYLLLNVEKLSGVKYSSVIFFICGLAAVFGIIWRFCYNQTYYDKVHNQKSKFGDICAGVQDWFYWFYIGLTFFFFVSVLCAGYNYICKAEQNEVVSKVALGEVAKEVEKDLRAVSDPLGKILKDGIIQVEVVRKDGVKNQEKNQGRP